jgi:hypothetical protein
MGAAKKIADGLGVTMDDVVEFVERRGMEGEE